MEALMELIREKRGWYSLEQRGVRLENYSEFKANVKIAEKSWRLDEHITSRQRGWGVTISALLQIPYAFCSLFVILYIV